MQLFSYISRSSRLFTSLNQIAFEKLGILNSKSTIFINRQKRNVMKFIKSQLKRKLNAELFNNHWKIKSNFIV